MYVERRKKRTAKIGLFGVGHDKYWSQFEGLYDELMGYMKDLEELIKQNNDVEIVNFGMIDNSFRSYEAVKQLKAAN